MGPVLQAALARHHRHLPAGPGAGQGSPGGAAHSGQVLHPLLHSLHQEALRQSEEEVPQHAGDCENRADEA